MIDQDFNTIREMANFFETRVEKLEPNEEKKKSSAAVKKFKDKKSTKKRK